MSTAAGAALPIQLDPVGQLPELVFHVTLAALAVTPQHNAKTPASLMSPMA
jgi:hypothetical protein